MRRERKDVPAAGRSLEDLTRVDRTAFSMKIGLRAGVFVSVPLLLGLLTGQKELVYVTLGAWFLTNAGGPRNSPTPMKLVFLACFTLPLAFGLGTIAGTTGSLAILLMGSGIFISMWVGGKPEWAPVSAFTAIFFAVGVGLPGGSEAAAWSRLIFSFTGALWGLLGMELRNLSSRRRLLGMEAVTSLKEDLTEARFAELKSLMERSEIFKQAMVVGIASALGLGLGMVLGLPRDFWIVVTIIFALRPSIPATIKLTSLIVVGTVVGALIAALLTFEVVNDYLLWVFLLVFSVAFYATRGMNLGLSQIFMTPFIIVLLNVLYPGQWELAGVRILDVAIGGTVAILAAEFLQNRRVASLKKLVS